MELEDVISTLQAEMFAILLSRQSVPWELDPKYKRSCKHCGGRKVMLRKDRMHIRASCVSCKNYKGKAAWVTWVPKQWLETVILEEETR